jgi:hypothetical protein
MPMTDTLPDLVSPRARRTDPITSHEAADTNDVAASRQYVMFMAIEHGAMTDHQMIKRAKRAGSFFSESRLRTARHELMQPQFGALLVWTGERGPSATRPFGARVWAVAA